MYKPLLACLAAAALPAAALAQPPVAAASASEWSVSGSPQGCIAHTTLSQGTVVSVLAGPGQQSLLFLVQNKGWSTLEDGAKHKVAVQLDGRSPWQFDAVAKTELDADGPGYLFTVAPGDAEGAKFLNELAGAGGMNVGPDGTRLEGARLSGGGSAMTRLAQCMSKLWGGGEQGGEAERITASGEGVRL